MMSLQNYAELSGRRKSDTQEHWIRMLTGVLPVCFGKATKLCDLLTDKDKTYETVLLLGRETDTQDISGTVLSEKQTGTVTEDRCKKCGGFFCRCLCADSADVFGN